MGKWRFGFVALLLLCALSACASPGQVEKYAGTAAAASFDAAAVGASRDEAISAGVEAAQDEQSADVGAAADAAGGGLSGLLTSPWGIAAQTILGLFIATRERPKRVARTVGSGLKTIGLGLAQAASLASTTTTGRQSDGSHLIRYFPDGSREIEPGMVVPPAPPKPAEKPAPGAPLPGPGSAS